MKPGPRIIQEQRVYIDFQNHHRPSQHKYCTSIPNQISYDNLINNYTTPIINIINTEKQLNTKLKADINLSIYQIQREQPYNFSTYLPRYATILVHSFLASFGENKKQKKQLLESLPLRVNKNYNIHICYSLQEHSRTNHEAREKVGLKYQMASQIHIPDSSTNHSCSCKMRVIDHTRIARSITKVYSPNHWENTYRDHIYHEQK